LKLVWIALITVTLSLDCIGVTLGPRSDDQQLTDIDLQESRQLAIEFTTRYLRTTDLSLLIKDLFVKDFIERYKEAKLRKTVNPSPSVYFVPGLEYNSRLLAEAGPKDWLRFYTAANNFVFFGIMSGIKNSKNAANISANEMYPSGVIELLSTNPSLENMIVRKGKSKPVSSVVEMQKATATLEQSVSIMQQKAKSQSPLNINEKELIKAMEEDEFFRPTLTIVDDQLFGLPKGTRVIFINTPILFRLMLIKTNSTKLEILWADPFTGG